MDPALAKIPERDGETLFIPPFEEYGYLLEKNLALWGDYPDGQRSATQEEFLKLATLYTKSLGLDPGKTPQPGKPVVSAGSQPEAIHPGVAIKNMALIYEAEKLGATPLFITVDSDEVKGVKTLAPTTVDGVIKSVETSLFGAEGRLFETAKPAISPGQFVDRLRLVAGACGGKKLEAPKREVERFLDAISRRPLPDSDYTGRAIILRRMWEESVTGGFLELPVSHISKTAPFILFAKEIIEDIENFSTIYNGELARYRKERKLRYKANPFPDLAKDQEFFETPFWLMTEGGRTTLYTRKDGRGHFLKGVGGDEIPADEVFSGGGVWGIRPKAITLSIFLRLYVCDLFIHGVGGAHYDNVTDGIVERYYNKKPPAYTCVTATVHPEIPVQDPSSEIAKIKRRLRDIKQNPESMAELADRDFSQLAKNKVKLVGAIKETGADRKKIGGKITSLNREMAKAFGSATAKMESRLKELATYQKEFEAVTRRDYPYFFFNPENIVRLLR